MQEIIWFDFLRRKVKLSFYRMYITDFFSVDVHIDVNTNFYLSTLGSGFLISY